ncbi:hypothetical protein RJ639_008703 [Escallonia herrerae]|uniref:ENHANCER OF AG-4 protein 2 n=1 Tax=Escallonia herrerae TaxID=1293975 RepID=A0AA88VU11_9ASTE|nr:hypothetical protein RJ639_008703 [Escallonia herrerae]
MAPGRKRGARTKAKKELRLGDLVLAKVKGFPAWPAKISKPEDWKRPPDPKKYFVQFFGTEEIAFVAPADIQAFTNDAKNKLLARCQGKTVKYFAPAVKEICKAFEELEGITSSGLRDDSDRSAFGSETPSVDGLVDDNVDCDSKDGIGTDGPDEETETIVHGDHGSGLERCSFTKRNKVSMDSTNPPKEEEVCTSDAEGGYSSGRVTGLGVSSSPLVASVHAKQSDGGQKVITNGRMSKKVVTGSKRKPDSSGGQADLRESNQHVKDGIRRMTPGGRMKDSHPDDVKSDLDVISGKKAKTMLKDKMHSEMADDFGKEPRNGLKELDKDELSGRKMRGQLGDGKHSLATKEVSHSVKRSKFADFAGDAAKGSVKTKRRTDVPDIKPGNAEINRSVSRVKDSCDLDVHGDEDILPPAKRQRPALEKKSEKNSIPHVYDSPRFDKVKSPHTQLHTKRRAVRMFDEDDDQKPKTPVHGGSARKLDAPARAIDSIKHAVVHGDRSTSDRTSVRGGSARKVDASSRATESFKSTTVHGEGSVPDQQSVRDSGRVENGASKEMVSSQQALSPNFQKNVDRHRKLVTGRFSRSPGETDSEKVSSKEVKVELISPGKSPSLVVSPQKNVERHRKVATDISSSPGKIDPDKGSSKEVKLELTSPGKSPSSFLAAQKYVERHRKVASPGKIDSAKASSMETKLERASPVKSPLSFVAAKTVVEQLKHNKLLGKVSGNVGQKKAQAGSHKGSGVAFDSFNHYQNQATERSKTVLERQKTTTPKSSLRLNDSILVAAKSTEHNFSAGERLEAGTDDKTNSFIDSKIAESDLSMKHLIAVAQAKRREAQTQSFAHGYLNSVLVPATDVVGGSPVSPNQSIPPDVQGYHPHTSLASPPSHIHDFPLNNYPDTEELEERRVSSGHRNAGGELSGGTEAAVARDAFEGMIETLSRTKESIGRATRLAIDCAKYGIANEVVELLIRKLESEASFHRRVDLFFLVDSITQCSHSQKGIAGASYIPTVQAALPRLLGAAAPPGAGARENRRQCLKVLRLWLERKIFPDSLLRRYMDDIGVTNEDTAAGFFLKRPSRAERAVDDPIREMEGMLVDEYGSNATFQLPGFFSSHAFQEDEEEDDLPCSSYKGSADRSPLELTHATGETETSMFTPSDRRHCILEAVDGELEMEDVSGYPKDEKPSVTDVSWQEGSDKTTELPPLPEGSPPLPLDSPPPTPPLPTSPAPLPPLPPPLSPPPPPPPLPPSHQHPLLQPPAGPPASLLPQPSLQPPPSMMPQQLQPFQPSINGTPSGNQLVQLSANTHHGAHIETAGRSEVYLQQSPCFVPAGVCNSREPPAFTSLRPLDYGHNDVYAYPQASQPNQQFRPDNASLSQRASYAALPPQTPSSHFSYSKSTVQQHPQHPYPPPYSLPNHADGSRRYAGDEQWRVPANEFNADNQRGVWISGGRASSSSGPPFAQEGGKIYPVILVKA